MLRGSAPTGPFALLGHASPRPKITTPSPYAPKEDPG